MAKPGPKPKPPPPPNPVGRPTLYDPSMLKRVTDLCLLGLTNQQIADAIGVSLGTFDGWKQTMPEFSRAIYMGRDDPSIKVTRSLFQRATGAKHREVVITQHQGVITKTNITKYYPPETNAIIFYLKNRHPDQWRETRGADGGGPGGEGMKAIPIAVSIVFKDGRLPGRVEEGEE